MNRSRAKSFGESRDLGWVTRARDDWPPVSCAYSAPFLSCRVDVDAFLLISPPPPQLHHYLPNITTDSDTPDNVKMHVEISQACWMSFKDAIALHWTGVCLIKSCKRMQVLDLSVHIICMWVEYLQETFSLIGLCSRQDAVVLVAAAECDRVWPIVDQGKSEVRSSILMQSLASSYAFLYTIECIGWCSGRQVLYSLYLQIHGSSSKFFIKRQHFGGDSHVRILITPFQLLIKNGHYWRGLAVWQRRNRMLKQN